MKNNYRIIDKELNESWENWVNSRIEGSQTHIPFNWKYEQARKKMKQLSKKGYFKRVSKGGIDFFTRTTKLFNLTK